MRNLLPFLFLCIPALAGFTAEKTEKPAAVVQSNDIYYLQIRVIFAGTTGIKGTIPHEMVDMRNVLLSAFDYPSYELSNTIRLSLFADEEATAMVFPEHYIRITPKGPGKDGKTLRIKAEIYQVQPNRDSKTRISMGEPPNRIGVQEKEKHDGENSPFPIISSSFLLSDNNWEAVGGIPVRVNMQGMVRSNALSSSPLSSTNQNAPGQQKYLILGIKLEGR